MVGLVIAAFIAGIVLTVLVFSKKRRKYYREYCSFSDGVSRFQFENIIRTACSPIRRLKIIDIDDAKVRCQVKSNSGLSSWEFTMDFNDNGHLTGQCVLSTDDDESIIPEMVSLYICNKIKSLLNNITYT